MNVSSINFTSAYQAPLEPVVQKNVEQLVSPSASPFRAWTRTTGKMLAATSSVDTPLSLPSSEAFWSQWPGKRWIGG